MRNTSPWECPRCLASPGSPCVYTTGNGIHREPADGRLRYVDNVAGQPMTTVHHGRPRVRCVPLGRFWVQPGASPPKPTPPWAAYPQVMADKIARWPSPGNQKGTT